MCDTRKVCEELGADTVLVARGAYSSSSELRQIAWDLGDSDIDLVVVPSLTDIAGPRIHMRPVAGLPLLHVEGPQADEAGGIGKRLFDIAGALVALAVTAPLMLVVAAAIWLEDRNPVVYRQVRIGKDGREFGCFKFRSMYVDAERAEAHLRQRANHNGALFKLPEDPRVTRVGRILRRYSLDELPAAPQRAPRGDEPGRSPPAAGVGGRDVHGLRPPPAARPPRNDRPLAGVRQVVVELGRSGTPRPLLRRQLVDDLRPRHHDQDREGSHRPQRRLLTPPGSTGSTNGG